MKSYSALVQYTVDSDLSGVRMGTRIIMSRTRYLLYKGKLAPYFDTSVSTSFVDSLEMLRRGLHVKWFSRGYN